MDKKLVLAGQGMKVQDGIFKGDGFELSGKHLEYLGSVGLKQRGELMSKAKAVFVLTQYHGPGETVHLEAMACGTPIITTDFGIFSETNIPGVTGYRTRTMGEILWAMQAVEKLNPQVIRDYAINNFGLEKVKMQFHYYFEQLYQLWENNGYYSKWNEGIVNNRYSNYRI